jgi:NitT/TauT family transport system ATP-binding protein
MSPVLSFDNVSFTFPKEPPIFSALSLKLGSTTGAGFIVAIIGASGAGKSTFSKLASGELQATSGTVDLIGSSRRVTTIPQRPVLFEALSVEENLSVLGMSTTLGNTFDSTKVRLVSERLNLDLAMGRRADPSTLSGGEAQRLMLGRSQLVTPDLMILDEPCASLDNFVKARFLKDLREQVDSQESLALLITHNWAEAKSVADMVLFIARRPSAPATIHYVNLTNAESKPPSIDAAFAVHWPNILEIDSRTANSTFNVAIGLLEVDDRILIFYSSKSRAVDKADSDKTKALAYGIVLPDWISRENGVSIAVYNRNGDLKTVY